MDAVYYTGFYFGKPRENMLKGRALMISETFRIGFFSVPKSPGMYRDLWGDVFFVAKTCGND